MDSTQVPARFPIPFANNADPTRIRTIPTASSQTPGAASLFDGFPGACFIPPTAGGIPPFGEDFNGILFMLSNAMRWLQSGGLPSWDAQHSIDIGGYPLDATLISADGTHFWRSTVENNVTNPDAGGAGWVVLQASSIPFSSITGVPNFAQISDVLFFISEAFELENQSLNFSGFQRLPGGLLLQWGRFTATTTDTPFTVALPTSFESIHFASFVSVVTSGPVDTSQSAYAIPNGLSNVILTSDVATGSFGEIPLFFFSIGV